MPYISKYTEDLNDIISDIKNGDLNGENGALNKFEKYLLSLQEIGKYDKEDWNINLRKKIYEFGRVFLKKDGSRFIDMANKVLKIYPDDKTEIIEFIYSEIIWNFFEIKNEYIGDFFKKLIKKYQNNPEFHHSYANLLRKNGCYVEASQEARLALKIEGDNNVFRTTTFNIEKAYFNLLIEKRKIDRAREIIEKMSGLIREEDVHFNNMLVIMNDRLNDHIIIDKKIGNINILVANAISKERRRIMEILGIFVAILGFVFTNINIALTNLGVRDILLLMLGMAIVLVDFMVAVSYLYPSTQNNSSHFLSFLGHKRFWALIISIGFLCAIVLFKK